MGSRYSVGGATGIRTRDLFIANEARYQLRHSPFVAHQDYRRRPTKDKSQQCCRDHAYWVTGLLGATLVQNRIQVEAERWV